MKNNLDLKNIFNQTFEGEGQATYINACRNINGAKYNVAFTQQPYEIVKH